MFVVQTEDAIWDAMESCASVSGSVSGRMFGSGDINFHVAWSEERRHLHCFEFNGYNKLPCIYNHFEKPHAIAVTVDFVLRHGVPDSCQKLIVYGIRSLEHYNRLFERLSVKSGPLKQVLFHEPRASIPRGHGIYQVSQQVFVGWDDDNPPNVWYMPDFSDDASVNVCICKTS
jgi:hypothetical protein